MPAFSQTHPSCPRAPALEVSTASVATSTALDAIGKLLAKAGVDIDVRMNRDSILRDKPRADQVMIVLTMANTLCEMIWSDTNLKGEEKADRYTKMMLEVLAPAVGPRPEEKTDRRRRRRTEILEPMIVLAGGGGPPIATTPPAENELDLGYLPRQTGLLRDPPFYINDDNKYFVIVGSARTREEGLGLMNWLKSKAPRYDFALLGPYGDNPYYAVALASWVPRDVAEDVLRLARRAVAPGAYIWACRSTGHEC